MLNVHIVEHPSMETPLRGPRKETRHKYTEEEKKQLLANLDIEVAHRTRQFEETLANVLENFKNHHEGQVLRVPKLVRSITMGEFADKYNGDINECLRGLQKERQGGEPVPVDPALKKRKWVANEDGPGPEDAECSRAPKNARTTASPRKLDGLSKFRQVKTPGTNRISRHPNNLFPQTSPTKSRPLSPLKSAFSSTRPPSSRDFNPLLPKTPAFPRAPRKNESLMSINGSPLSNPLSGAYRDIQAPIGEEDEDESNPNPLRKLHKRATSIVIRRDPSFFVPSEPPGGNGSPLRPGSSQPNGHHDRPPLSRPPSQPSQSQSTSVDSQRQGRSHTTALMRVPTNDGLILEFDPFLTAPSELEALEGISESAKQQAKVEMARLVQEALSKWKL
ncbi:hypothetical protein SCHPADRAFT_881433 [Schizopora paradoxa]|uniref:Uncharacterized protein n=1 Tax=Schizopora paradoxa TaxID=27342 RepID=A0A0H2R729_9AGAM|nr:hypothetical protein SCHPADRAFT_881433 [Schizopora paradoxa]